LNNSIEINGHPDQSIDFPLISGELTIQCANQWKYQCFLLNNSIEINDRPDQSIDFPLITGELTVQCENQCIH
jgi:hypothetical protein